MAHSRVLRRVPAIAVLLVTLGCNLPADAAPGASTAPASEAAPPIQDACSNPLYPVMIGAAWTYSMTGLSTGTFTHSITDVRADGFTDQDVFSAGVTRTGEWKCEGGALTALSPASGASAVVATEQFSTEFQTTDITGVTLPASVNAGDTWTQGFTVAGTQSISGQELDAKGDVSYTCAAGPTETVTVPAAAFDALRVDCDIDLKITVGVAGFGVPTNLASTTTMWYAPGVGLIKVESEISGFGRSTFELMSYSFP